MVAYSRDGEVSWKSHDAAVVGSKKNLCPLVPLASVPVQLQYPAPLKEPFPSHAIPHPPHKPISHPLTRRRRSSPPPGLSPSACWLPFVFPVSPYDQPYSSYSAPICSNLGLSWPIRLGLASIGVRCKRGDCGSD